MSEIIKFIWNSGDGFSFNHDGSESHNITLRSLQNKEKRGLGKLIYENGK